MEKKAKKILYMGLLSTLLTSSCMKEMFKQQAKENVEIATNVEQKEFEQVIILDANHDIYLTNDVKILTFKTAEETYQNLYVYKRESTEDYDVYKSITNPSIELVRNKKKLEDQYQIISTKSEINCEKWQVWMVVTSVGPSTLDYELASVEEEKLNYHMNKVIASPNLSLTK